MNEILVIEGTQIERIEYNGQPVLSLPMVDAVHQRPERTAVKAFSRNKDKFIQGVDYYNLPYSEWSNLRGHEMPHHGGQMPHQKITKKGHKGDMTFLTLSGYLMLVKTFTDDLSWKVQRMLVEGYFKLKELQASAERTLETMALKDELIASKDKIVALYEKLQTKRERRKITKEELDKIKELASEGKGPSEIAVILGRKRGTIHNFFRAWGLPIPSDKKPSAYSKD